ncbi:MAG: hypothetical protein NDJ65_09680 [Paludibacteraceae bacterium]|nr:hypothetical protein [Paludibacteraceae bacterium]
MRRKMYSIAALCIALAASSTILTSCEDDEDKTTTEVSGELENGSTISGDITSNTTLAEGYEYKLSGGVHVKEGATLTIKPGVKITAIDDDTPDYILIEQGAKIDAQGTASNPIVMTSETPENKWGGIHICGKAHTNAESGSGSSEIGGAKYGGSDDKDNSGTLRYIRLEYTGFALDEEHEANGISFYGVGSGTTVDHIESYKGGDDGFEFFGGSVNVNNMVSFDSSDDSFDWTEGWNGSATNILAYQMSAENDCLIEADNNGKNYDAIPVSRPTIKNAILIGNGGDGRGIRLRAGTQVILDNVVACGKNMPLTVETGQTETALKNGDATITNTTISANLNSKESIYTNEDFIKEPTNNIDAIGITIDAAKGLNSWLNESWIVLE